MMTMGQRFHETNNLNKLGFLGRKSRRHYYHNLDSLHIQKKGGQDNIHCTINDNYHYKLPSYTYNKFQAHFHSQADDHSADNKKYSHTFVDMDNTQDYSYNSCKYEKKTSRKMSPSYEKNTGNSFASTAASDSDSSSSNNSSSSSELNGFKIVHEGKVVHNEIEEDPDSPYKIGLKVEDTYEKFAASVLVTGPNVKEISIPSFA